MHSRQKIRWQPDDDGPLTETNMIAKFRQLGFSCQTYHYAKGTYFPPHSHAVNKLDGVLKGKFKIEMAGQSIILEAGDYVYVDKQVVHSAEVVGDETVISIDGVAL